MKKKKNIFAKIRSVFERKKPIKASLGDHWRGSLPYGSMRESSIYEALGYPETISYNDYLERYHRQDVAQRVIRAPVDTTWRYDPQVVDSTNEGSAFEQKWAEIAEKTSIYSKMRQADLLASLGRYSVLYIGLQGSVDLLSEPSGTNDVVYFTPISEKNADITTFDENIWSKRYGLPTSYTIQSSVDNDVASFSSNQVHWSRVIHIAENTLESEVYGIPKLEPIFNRLIGLEKLAGGSPEMYWKGARPGYVAKAAENSVLNIAQLNDMKEQLSDFVNNLTRWLFAEGVEVEALAPQVVTPSDHVEVQLKLISSASQIPLRILVGSEKGELASGQDERAWLSYIDARRQQVAEAIILKPTIDRLISIGVLPTPENGYEILWQSINITSEKERAEIGRILTDALLKYTSSPGGSALIPVEKWLEKVWNMSPSEIEMMLSLGDDVNSNGEPNG
jgi:hypothetical protein